MQWLQTFCRNSICQVIHPLMNSPMPKALRILYNLILRSLNNLSGRLCVGDAEYLSININLSSQRTLQCYLYSHKIVVETSWMIDWVKKLGNQYNLGLTLIGWVLCSWVLLVIIPLKYSFETFLRIKLINASFRIKSINQEWAGWTSFGQVQAKIPILRVFLLLDHFS